MSSSSIEVMSGNDVDMVLMGNVEDRKEPDIHTLTAADPLQSYMIAEEAENEEEVEEMETDFENLDPIGPSPGSIIFSPQDMMATSRVKRGRGRGRGRGKGTKRSDALTIKIEEGGDYSKIDVPVACEICGKIVANGKTLVQHMATHSDVKPFQCPHCPKSFARMVHLQGHLVLHGIEKQFECPVCHQRFSRQDCVKVHMRLHDKSKCVFCEVCHKAFLTLGALNIHMRIHRGEKPFKCHLCGKCFTQKNHVITHIKRHTKVTNAPFSKKLGPRMFQCEHCPRSFIRLSDYERHVQWNHGAVADTGNPSLADKLPSYDNYVEREKLTSVGSQFSSLETTLNNKVKKKSIRKVMCTIGTQTDQEGGHVIIPRQYQNSSMIETSTQVSAPPTPRATEEELYENDIFDEGMDRNFSSDEDEEYEEQEANQDQVTYQESETTMPYFQDSAATSAKDEAFDAVLGKPKPEPVKNEKLREPEIIESNEEAEAAAENDHGIQSELGTEYSKRDEAFFSNDPVPEPSAKKDVKITEQISLPKEKQSSTPHEHHTSKPQTANSQKFASPLPPRATRIMENFNTKNWKGRVSTRGRGRGRGKPKGIMGLTGATHLRLIRKSMINFITEKTEQMNSSEKVNTEKAPSTDGQFEDDDASPDRRVKRQTRSKQHGKDFICNVKTCETCNPGREKACEEVNPESNTEEFHAVAEVPATSSSGAVKDQSQKLLQFLISGDESNLQGTDFKLISDVKDIQLDSKRLRLDDLSSFKTPTEYEGSKLLKGGYPVDISNLKQDKTEFFTPVSGSGDFVSPPVELQAFCIPTYSCKLCGREFRFEGKLHRHIESVHQNKAIFSPDVKPGRGAARDIDREYQVIMESPIEEPVIIKKGVPRNPEIEALRSEWDDDDDDDEDSENNDYQEENISMAQETNHASYSTMLKRAQTSARPIITREIVPVTETITDVYVSGVKVNINKITGLAGPDAFEFSKKKYVIPSASHQEAAAKPQDKVVNSLDTKCRKLLEKLFDHTLLIECGLFEEHVSVVLGRLLQHYGVKMIEDYGQGQYEVLKYNLWRLIEWKVTMEQMEEFYTEGKSVEEMMDDIMNSRVPIIAHHELQQEQVQTHIENQVQNNDQIQTVETVQISDNQLMLSQVANVLSGQLNLGDGVTQVVLAQDVSPEMLQGAHIVTIDPATGQVLSQVTADQVILTESLTDDMNQQIQSVGSHVVTHTTHAPTVVTSLPPGSIVASNPVAAQQVVASSMDSDQMMTGRGTIIKIETTSHST